MQKLFDEVSDKPATVEDIQDMKKALVKWGGSLILLGIVHILLPGILDSAWGIFIIGIGILTILVRKRIMYIIIGVTIILAGISNFAVGVLSLVLSSEKAETSYLYGPHQSNILSEYPHMYLYIFAIAQIAWGVYEIKKYKLYKTAD